MFSYYFMLNGRVHLLLIINTYFFFQNKSIFGNDMFTFNISLDLF